MAFNKLEDANALLLYRVGPVLMCSPTLQVESVIVPPAISRASASSHAEPGMFKSMYGMVRVVDLRVRFGVDAAQCKQPGQIIIVEVTGGHAGFWVDEIEDVVAFPQTGWSQVPSHVPGSVFSRALMQENVIRLYAEFDRLDGFKASGYLREHIRSLQQVTQKEQTTSTYNDRSPVQTTSVQSQVATSQSLTSHAAAVAPLDLPSKTHAQPISRFDQANKPINASNNPPENLPEKAKEKAAEKTDTTHNNDMQNTADNQSVSPHKASATSAHAINHLPAPNGMTQARQKTHQQAHHHPHPMQAQYKADRPVVSGARSADSVAPLANKIKRADDGGLKIQTLPTAAESEQAGAGWLWWFVLLLLLFIVLFIFMQNSSLLQRLFAPDKAPALQARVDLQQDTLIFQSEKNLDNDATQYAPPTPPIDTSSNAIADIEDSPDAQIVDDLTDVIYIEPDSGDLTITVNDYEEDSAVEGMSAAEILAQKKMATQLELDGKQEALQTMPQQEREADNLDSAEQKQSLPETKTVDAEPMQADEEHQAVPTKYAEHETQKVSSVEAEVVNKTASRTSRRLQHVVVKGDTLWSITGRYINKPWRYPEIARLSNIDNPHLIYPGQRVIIVLNYKNRSE